MMKDLCFKHPMKVDVCTGTTSQASNNIPQDAVSVISFLSANETISLICLVGKLNEVIAFPTDCYS